MNNEIKEKFLPIGTVVLLKDGIRELMITSYCPVPKGEVFDKNGKVEVEKDQFFDYGACYYPEGIVDSKQIFMFNHDQIEKISFIGYETEASKKFNELLKQEIEKKSSSSDTNVEKLPEE